MHSEPRPCCGFLLVWQASWSLCCPWGLLLITTAIFLKSQFFTDLSHSMALYLCWVLSRISALSLSLFLLALDCCTANVGSATAPDVPRPARSTLAVMGMGSARPLPSDPKPCPWLHPILASILKPLLPESIAVWVLAAEVFSYGLSDPAWRLRSADLETKRTVFGQVFF